MAELAATKPKLSPVFLAVGVCVALILILGGAWLKSGSPRAPEEHATAEATAYLPYLQLSGVTMKAAENFMRQQVVYVDGRIANRGSRVIERLEVYCIFSGVDGREIHRERVPVVDRAAGGVFKPQQERAFELPFDSPPEGWNQALPRLVIAQIRFAR